MAVRTYIMRENDYYLTESISAKFPDLAGKTAIITGASRGIGCGIAYFLGRKGMKLVITARSEKRGQKFTKELIDKGIDAVWVTADLSDFEQAKMVFKTAVNHLGKIDLLVNNAAHLGSTNFLKLDKEEYRESFENNVRIVYRLSYYVARHMAKRKQGGIIHISSVGGLRAHRGLSGYDASKGAVDALTRAMALSLAPYGVRVNAVAPGATQRYPITARNQYFSKKQAKAIPLGRLATPEDIGAAVAFLASDAASYITGQILYVDGGLTTQLSPPGLFV